MRIHWRILGGIIVCAMLVTGLLSPLRADRAAISATVAPEVEMPESEPAAGPTLRLTAGTFDPLRDDGPGSATAALQLAAYPGDGLGYYLVQFQGPIAASEVDALKAAGVDVFDYIPDFAFIVKMDNAGRAAVDRMAQIRWVGLYQPAYRLAPDLLARTEAAESASAPAADESLTLVVSVFRGETVTPVASAIQGLRGVILDQSQTKWQSKFKVTLSASALAELAAIPGVRWIESAPQWRLHNDKSDNIMGVREVWDSHGLYGDGQTVAVCDTGLDQGSTAPASLHNDFENGSGVSRVVALYDLVGGGDGASDVNSGHGTHVAGSVLGNGDLSGATPASHTYPETAYVGMAPEASLIFQAVEDNDTEYLDGIPLDLNDLFLPADTAGADLHTNSWGSDEASAYTTDSEAVDEYMWDHKDFTIFFSAGNAGIDADSDGVVDLYSQGSPATAKNCVTVGASENNRPTLTDTWGDYWPADFPTDPVYNDKIADDIAGLAAFSSRGPVLDYRYKPDVVAPGTFIASVKSSLVTDPNPGWGAIDANYMYMGGTSMATPLTAGAAAIVRQFYTDLQSHTPSAALIKATLVNGATDIYPGQYGTGAAQEIPTTRPTNVAGWGRVNIQNSIFPTAPRTMTYVDQTTGLGTAATDVYNYQITNSGEPFRVTLAWTDYPGSPAADGALVNDLDLTVTGPSGTIYYPNNALDSDGSSSTTHDRVNNLEGIDIASPATGVYTVTVNGYHVPHGPQPYALIASGVFTTANTAPTLAGLPDQTLVPGQSKDNAIDLWTYASDVQDVDADLAFTITNAPPAGAGVTIDSDRYIDINPAVGFTTTVPVEVQVTDTGGLTDTDTFTITFEPNTPPELTPPPDQTVGLGESIDNAIDLWTYAFDVHDTGADLTFTIINSPPAGAGVTIDSNRYIDITPTIGFEGTVPVEVQVEDTGGLTDTTIFTITFLSNAAPTLAGLPDQTIIAGQSKDNAIDLWTYASDGQDIDADLAFTITNAPPADAGVTIDSNRYIDINPTAGYVGTVPVEVEVTDTGGMTDTDTFTINFLETQFVYLPLVLRVHPLPPELPTVIDAIGDADISQYYADTNDGASSTMYVGYDDYHEPDWKILRSLVKFDVSEIPANTPISSAVLRVYYAGYYDYEYRSRTITSYRISSNWSEASVTWNSAPTMGETYGSVSLIAKTTPFGWCSIDVTNLVRGWVNGTLPNYGVMLRGPEQSGSDSSWRSFATKEAGSTYTPYLQLTYTTMAATEERLDTVVPVIGSVPSNGTQLPKRLGGVSQDTLCDVFGCLAP